MNFRLRQADRTLRLFLTMFLLVITFGYAIGLSFVHHTTSLQTRGIQEQFLGTPEGNDGSEIKYAKSPTEMFVFMHNHILSTAIVFFAVGMIFYFSSLASATWKAILMIEPLVAIATTFGSIALVRYVSPLFSILVMISGISLFVCYGAMLVLIVWELWFVHR